MHMDAESDWCAWIWKYHAAIRRDTELSMMGSNDSDDRLDRISNIVHKRRHVQNSVNPKYVLRNWMGLLAYEKASTGDYSVIEELTGLLERPYDEQDPILSDKWYAKTPDWARFMPGVTFMS